VAIAGKGETKNRVTIYAQKTTTLCRRGVVFLAVSLPAAEIKNGARLALKDVSRCVIATGGT
jgi:hypothetical protein